VLDRSLLGLRQLIDRTLADVRLQAGQPAQLCDFSVDRFIAEVQVAATLEAKSRNCGFAVGPVDAALRVRGDKQILYSALSNLLQNAFKFTKPGGQVWLRAHETGDRIRIEVADGCGGLPAGKAEAMIVPFRQHDANRSGMGLGLSIARRAVEASGGHIDVRDQPGVGCTFTIDLPRLA
jgi:signal transduction histidine kinase